MREWFRSWPVPVAALLILAACGSDREPASPVESVLDVSGGVAGDCPGGAISEDIAAIFPAKKSRSHVATVTCGQIFRDLSQGKHEHAVNRAFEFLETTLQQNQAGELLDPDPSVEERIVSLFDAIFAALGIEFPDIDPEALATGAYAIGALNQNGPPLTTVNRHATVDDGSGLLGPVQVFIAGVSSDGGGLGVSSVSHPCPQGVDDRFDCYPLFFDYTVFPESNVNPAVGIQIGQCNVSPPGVEVLLLTPEGFLPESDAPAGLDCTDVVPAVAATGWRRFVQAAMSPVAPLLRVTPAFAGKNPVGGRMSAFSPVAPADPLSGGLDTPPHIVVFNDLNYFDDIAMADPNNVQLVENLVGYTAGGPRDDGSEVWFDCRATFYAEGGCIEDSALYATIEAAGLSAVKLTEGSLAEIPDEVKVVVLWLPTTAYSTAEINGLKDFAAEGGRIVFMGEHGEFYGTYIPTVQNPLLEALGSTLRAVAAQVNCTGQHVLLPGTSIQSHQITDGLTGLSFGCSSRMTLGEADVRLWMNVSGVNVLAAVGPIDTTPIAELAGARSIGSASAFASAYDPLGNLVDEGSGN